MSSLKNRNLQFQIFQHEFKKIKTAYPKNYHQYSKLKKKRVIKIKIIKYLAI